MPQNMCLVVHGIAKFQYLLILRGQNFTFGKSKATEIAKIIISDCLERQKFRFWSKSDLQAFDFCSL